MSRLLALLTLPALISAAPLAAAPADALPDAPETAYALSRETPDLAAITGSCEVTLDAADLDFADAVSVDETCFIRAVEDDEGYLIFTPGATPVGFLLTPGEGEPLAIEVGAVFQALSKEGYYVAWVPYAAGVMGLLVETAGGEREIWAEVPLRYIPDLLDLEREARMEG